MYVSIHQFTCPFPYNALEGHSIISMIMGLRSDGRLAFHEFFICFTEGGNIRAIANTANSQTKVALTCSWMVLIPLLDFVNIISLESKPVGLEIFIGLSAHHTLNSMEWNGVIAFSAVQKVYTLICFSPIYAILTYFLIDRSTANSSDQGMKRHAYKHMNSIVE